MATGWRQLEPQQIDTVIRMTRAGATLKQIAEVVGCTERTVSRTRKRLGLSSPPSPIFSAEELARADQLLSEGASFAEVARTIGRSTESVWRRFPGRGWTHRQVIDHITTLRTFGGAL